MRNDGSCNDIHVQGTSCVHGYPRDMVLGRGWKLCWGLRQLNSPGAFWITGNGGWLGANGVFWPKSLRLQSCLTPQALQLSAAPARKCSISLTGHLRPSWSIYQRGEVLGLVCLSTRREGEPGVPASPPAERLLQKQCGVTRTDSGSSFTTSWWHYKGQVMIC